MTARDPQLPGLAVLLDRPGLLERLGARCPGRVLSDLELTYLRYKPGTSCLAGYRLRVDGDQTWLTCTARRRDARDKLEKALDKPALPGPFGPGRFVLPELAMVVASFPNDSAIDRLSLVTTPEGQAKLLGKLGLPREAAIEALHYRPGRRFVGKAHLEGQPLAVVKLHASEAFARALGNAQAFSALDGALAVPRLLGASAKHRAVASEWLRGSVVGDGPELALRLGQALAVLHRQEAPGLTEVTVQAQTAGALAMLADLVNLAPHLTRRAQEFGRRLERELAKCTTVAALHGDCHLDQVLDLGAVIGLIDLDEAARGPAAWDLGNLLAHMAVTRGSLRLDEAFAQALLEGYRCAGGQISPEELAAQTSLGLLRLASRPFRDQQQDWPTAMSAILAAAEAALPERPPSTAKAGAPTDPLMPLLASALEPLTAARAFAEAGIRARVVSARLVRHKPGRRCLIAYELHEETGRRFRALGKQRAKGADRRVFAFQRQLWEEGFRPGGAAGACVPEPLGLVPALNLWLQAAVAGQGFSVDTWLPEETAAAVAALHASRASVQKSHSLDDELSILQARLTALAQRRPEWARRTGALRQAAVALAGLAEPVEPRPIHRDFYHDHLLREGADIYLLDLDLVCLGDPAVDIGNFSAHLTELALRKLGNAHGWHGWQEGFADAACRRAGLVRADHVRIYEVLSLMRLVEIGERMPERQAVAAELLAECEARAQEVLCALGGRRGG